MKRFVIAAAICILPLPSMAQQERGVYSRYELGTLLNAVALNGAAATRTFNLPDGIAAAYGKLLLRVSFTHANDGTLTIKCVSPDDAAGTNDFDMTTCTTSAGACALNFVTGATTQNVLTGDKKFAVPLGIAGYDQIECSVTHNGAPAAGDIVTVTGWLVAD